MTQTRGVLMDLLKMHPMARKMEQAQKAFATALEQGDGNLAKQHLTEVQKLSDFLLEDLQTEIFKSENAATKTGAKDIYVNGVAPYTFQKEDNYVPLTGKRLSGTVQSRQSRSNFRPASGTFGRRG
tara:strand:+ start:257 stop:634 length:378 start_codon:yes stop_codon:yes gene_type:complete